MAEELLPRVVVGQRAVAQVIFREGQKRDQKWQGRGQTLSLPPAFLPATPGLLYPSYLPGLGGAVLTALFPLWQKAVARDKEGDD